MLDLSGDDLQQSGQDTRRIRTDENKTIRSDRYSIRQDALDDSESTNNSCSMIQQLDPQSSLSIIDKQDLYSEPVSANESLVVFREKYADEIWALKARTNYQIFIEAYLQTRSMLQGLVDSPFTASEILCGLERSQMVLLSCAIKDRGRGTLAPGCWNSRAWTQKQKDHFASTFTRLVRGTWYRRDVLDKWEELVKVSYSKAILC